MKFTEPKVVHLAGTGMDAIGVHKFLEAVGAEGWTTDAPSEGEALIEIAGKACYRSFSVDLNPNLRRVRKNDNRGYIGNSILGQKHGSVLEHVYDTYGYVGVSRVFTHEFVRHRHASPSQESLRFVRLTDLQAYFPEVFKEGFLKLVGEETGKDENWAQNTSTYLEEKMKNVFEYLEQVQLELAEQLDLDGLESFALKKQLTSAMRRMAPIGLATTIILTANLREWRHIIAMRTAEGAEEEIRRVSYETFIDLRNRYPNVFQDADVIAVDHSEIPEVRFRNEKV